MSIWNPFSNFHEQPIPTGYYDLLNDNDDDDNNSLGTPIDNIFTENVGAEDAVVTNAPGADVNDEDIVDDAGSLISAIEPLQEEVFWIEGINMES